MLPQIGDHSTSHVVLCLHVITIDWSAEHHVAVVEQIHIEGHTPIEQAIQACCGSLGRKPGPAEATLVSTVLHICKCQVMFTTHTNERSFMCCRLTA